MPRKTIKISEETLIKKLQQLRDELGHEPSITEIDDCYYLPSARQLQRKYGSIADLRSKAGFTTALHTHGDTRAKIAREAGLRAAEYETKIINKLFRKYPNVVRYYAYQQWVEGDKVYKNIACDAAIVDKNHVTLIDLFYPKDMHSYGGSLRIKRLKLENHPPELFDATYKNIFVCVNPKITQEMIDNDGTNKGSMTVLSLDSFTKRFF